MNRETGIADILVSASTADKYIKLFQTNNMKYTILDSNIQK